MIAKQRKPVATAGNQPIVVAVGPSGGAAAIRTAFALAARGESDVVVLSVVEAPPVFALLGHRPLLEPWAVEEQLQERRGQLHERLQQAGDLPGARLRRPVIEVTQGDPGHEIARVARARHARLIVMGLGPADVVKRLGAAGTAWATARRASCPVLAVTGQMHQLPRVVIAATDFSPESIHAAIESLDLVADGATVHLVHAWRPVELPLPVSEIEAANRAYAASIPVNFARMRTLIERGRAAKVETAVREGKAAQTVLDVARERGADLIVVGTHGQGLVERWLLGSTATAVLRGAECSALLVPPPPVAELSRLARYMTGSSVVRRPEQWNDELQAFVRRNHNRRTTLEIDDYRIGAQVQESGYALVGATYDPHDHHLALMFGDGPERSAHLTRSLGDVRSVAVASDAGQVDRALCVESQHGSALLTFLDPPARAPSSANA